jgi:hypothetical protein
MFLFATAVSTPAPIFHQQVSLGLKTPWYEANHSTSTYTVFEK